MRHWIPILVVALSSFWLVCPRCVTNAQIIPKDPGSFPTAVPSGDAGCSVEKSCAEVAPGMVENATGDSPLVANLDSLLKTGPSSRSAKAVPWAVQALTKARVDGVKTEPFEVRSSQGRGPISATNVVGEIRGWEKPDEFVILGAAMYAGGESGASMVKDNVAAEIVLIDAARVIHSSGSLPRRSVRFVLFDQQTHHFSGSRAYLQRHGAE